MSFIDKNVVTFLYVIKYFFAAMQRPFVIILFD